MQSGYQSNHAKWAAPLFFMLATALLVGCPKKISPVGKGPISPLTQEKEPLPSEAKPQEEGTEGGRTTSLNEEDIPFISNVAVSRPDGTTAVVSPISTPEKKGDMLEALFFDFGQWRVRSSDLPLIEKSAHGLSARPFQKLEIAGHADKRGTNEYNLVLAEKRANAVQEYLVQFGVPAEKTIVISYGEERPFCAEEDETCYQSNRRAQLYVQ